jgi:hypothetical protein
VSAAAVRLKLPASCNSSLVRLLHDARSFVHRVEAVQQAIFKIRLTANHYLYSAGTAALRDCALAAVIGMREDVDYGFRHTVLHTTICCYPGP